MFAYFKDPSTQRKTIENLCPLLLPALRSSAPTASDTYRAIVMSKTITGTYEMPSPSIADYMQGNDLCQNSF